MARAIRGALALTTVALAMSGSGVVLAAPGVCSPAGVPPPGSTVSCDGVFPGPIVYSVEDLTVILGATDPTTTVDSNGAVAVSLTGTTGNETLVNYAAITAIDAYGVVVSTTTGDISITTSGDISVTTAGYPNAVAVYAESYDGDVAVNVLAGADIVVYNSSGSGSGIYAYSQTGAVDVYSAGTIYVSTSGTAYGIYAASDDGVVTVTNTGAITANSSSDAYGIYAQSYGNVYVDNSGTVIATSTGLNSNATGIFVYTCDCYALDANVDNSGSVIATTTGDNGDAYGIYVYAYDVYGDANVTNDGSIDVNAYGVGGNATGIYVTLTDGDVTIDGAGDISAYSYSGDTYGIHVVVDGDGATSVTNGGAIDVVAYIGQGAGIYVAGDGDGDIYVGSTGSIDVVANQYAVGIHAYSNYAGDVDIDNSGDITVVSTLGAATGIFTSSAGADTTVDNSGSITVTTYGFGGSINGINAYGYNNATVINSGAITVDAQGVGSYANGIMVIAYAGDITVDSSGSISASATGQAHGIDISGNDGNVYVTTAGTIDATGSSAYGIQIGVYGYGNVYVDNGADITSYSGGFGNASGIDVHAYYGDITLDNTGDIYAYAAIGDASGIHADNSQYGDITINNGGAITVVGNDAYGIYAQTYGDVSVTNSGAIDVTSYGFGSAYGIFVYSNAGAVTVDNSGDITSTANGGGSAFGISVYAYGTYAIDVNNDADIVATATGSPGGAVGIYASASDGAVSITSAGGITAQAYASAFGIMSFVNGDGTIYVNHGDIAVTSDYFYGFGVLVSTSGAGDVTVVGTGDVTVDAMLGATGIRAYATGGGSVSVDSGGSIAASTTYGDATGIFGQSYSGDVSISVTGASIDVTSTYGNATGIEAYAYNDVYVYSSADILADAQGAGAQATGISAYAYVGDATVVSGGSITATSDSAANGIVASTGLDGSVTVTTTGGTIDVDSANGYAQGIEATASGLGDVTVTSAANLDVTSNYYTATGIFASAGSGDVLVDNAGTVSATSAAGQAIGISAYSSAGIVSVASGGSITVDSYATAYGIHASTGLGGDVTISTTGGVIDVSGAADAAYGIGIYATTTGDVDVSVGGAVSANANGDSYADAAGVYLIGYDVYFSVAGDVAANAAADPGTGSAYADGVHIDGTYVSVYTGAGSSISANADGFYANAVGLEVNGSYGLYLGLDGDIQAEATGSYAWATGVQATSYVDILVYSSADISAEATGSGYSNAIGVSISSLAGDIFFYNGGNITATGADSAVAVQLYGIGSTVFINQGTISAYADGYGGIAFLSGDADDNVYNNGTITGAIVTGDGDDTLEIASGATWNAFGDSDFGNGDDTITNYGSINMFDAVIDLGLPGAVGNAFSNYGTITVSGAYNIIDMEGGSAALAMSTALSVGPTSVPSSNPYAFYNYGLIDFRDGAPDDVLTIVGDFGGDGTIAVDVSGLNGTADMLYIDGSIVSGSINSIDVDLLDLPEDGFAEIPVVEVSGNSVSASFVLGSVDFTSNPFLTTNVSLVSNINSANTSPDMFSLRVSMSASDTGAIAAVLPAGVQLLMNDVVGNWHRRVIDDGGPADGKFSLWARVYRNKGTVNPEFSCDGIECGGFSFEQKNTGGEAGFDFAPSGRWNFGLILGKANANQDLRVGLGTSRIEGTVAGGYGTYHMPGGFYFDLSHRRLKFDAVIDTAQGEMLASGEAQTSNAESGYSFNYKGFEIEGQVQVTRTKLVSLDALSLVPATSTSASTLALAAEPEPIVFENDADLSSVSRVAVDLRKKFKTEPGTLWELHATLNRVRQSGARNQFRVTDSLGGETDIGGDSSLIDVGFTARRGLLLFYGALTWQDGGALQNFFGAQLGAKYTW
jgi:hypothetical protein